jgi:hypothetical protein
VTDEIVDQLVLFGDHNRVVRRLDEIIRRYRPASIGLCLRTSARPDLIARSAAVPTDVREELT